MKISALIKRLRSLRYHRLIVVLALLDDKDIKTIARLVARVADRVIVTQATAVPMPGRGWATLSSLSTVFKKYQRSVAIAKQKNPRRALEDARKIAGPDDAILITGSFYLSAEIRCQWYSEQKILRRRSSF